MISGVLAARKSFLLRLLLLMSAILAVIFASTGYVLHESILQRATQTVDQEVVANFQAYQALWSDHTHNLQQISSVISRMADVRATFLTRDRATIQDTAAELWSRISAGNALFAVADGNGKVIASVGERSPFQLDETVTSIKALTSKFPAQQTGFLREQKRLFQVVVTPVYVDTGVGKGLLDVLITGFEVDQAFLHSLKLASGGSDLIFTQSGKPLASTLQSVSAMREIGAACSASATAATPTRIMALDTTYLALVQPLPTLVPQERAELCIVRSLTNAEKSVGELLQQLSNVWGAGFAAALVCIFISVRRMMRPIAALDRAAAEISGGNYATRVLVQNEDELGRLGTSFNLMCASLESARDELIRHERLNSVARLATFVVHDLRNPLAAIYAGAEMLVDSELPANQVKRLARNMYQASRGVMEILQELLSAARNKTQGAELCLLNDLVQSAWEGLSGRSNFKLVSFTSEVAMDLELMLERRPIERVFHNLFENALEAIGNNQGSIRLFAELDSNGVLLHIRDSGKGIHPELQRTLFQPFASYGSAQGLGLGLALSKQTIVAHGGDLWADFKCPGGSHFLMRLPIELSQNATSSSSSSEPLTQDHLRPT